MSKMKKWDEVEKRIIQTKYGPREVPTEDCWMPDGQNIYLTLQTCKDNLHASNGVYGVSADIDKNLVAQRTEQVSSKHKVAGSTPAEIAKTLEECAAELIRTSDHLAEANILLGIVAILNRGVPDQVAEIEDGILRDLEEYYKDKIKESREKKGL